MKLPRHKRSQEGGGGQKPPPIEMPPMIKIITTKPNVISVSFCIFPYNNIHLQQTISNIDDQVA